jgi:hypothetical protein
VPSRQTEPLFLDSCVTAASALDSIGLLSLHERLRRTKERRVARLRLHTVRRPVSRRVTVHTVVCMEFWRAQTRLLRYVRSWEKSGRLLVSSFGCKDTRLEKGWKGHMSVDG